MAVVLLIAQALQNLVASDLVDHEVKVIFELGFLFRLHGYIVRKSSFSALPSQ